MESDLQPQHHFFHGHLQHQQSHQKQMNSGLMRYQSAPSSYFSSILDGDFCEEFLNRPSSPEPERIWERLLASTIGKPDIISNQNLSENKRDSPAREVVTQVNRQAQMFSLNKSTNRNDTRLHQQQQRQQQRNYSGQSQSFYQNQSKPPLPEQNSGSGMGYRAATSMGIDRLPPVKMSGGNSTNLVRHSSSPAGLFSNINIEIENGCAILRGLGGNFGAGNPEPYNALASRAPSFAGRMSPIAEMENKNMGENNPDNGGFGENRTNNYVASFPIGSWDDSSMMSASAKRLTEDDRALSGINASESESGETGNRPPMLAHHLSLPKTSAEISAVEKFLQFQDSVPCKIRAKRGCATHPRSIAERVRRTRISERMRKLQDLVPNMEKQTNTTDMLDLAVDYIKELERQVKTLSENRSRCTCTNRQQP